MAKTHQNLKHLTITTISFTAGFLIAAFLQGAFGWHALLAGITAHLITYYGMHELFTT